MHPLHNAHLRVDYPVNISTTAQQAGYLAIGSESVCATARQRRPALSVHGLGVNEGACSHSTKLGTAFPQHNLRQNQLGEQPGMPPCAVAIRNTFVALAFGEVCSITEAVSDMSSAAVSGYAVRRLRSTSVSKTRLSPLSMGNVPNADVLSPDCCNLLVVGCNGERIHVLGQRVLVKNTASRDIPNADLTVLFRSNGHKESTCTQVPNVFQDLWAPTELVATHARNRTSHHTRADPRPFSD